MTLKSESRFDRLSANIKTETLQLKAIIGALGAITLYCLASTHYLFLIPGAVGSIFVLSAADEAFTRMEKIVTYRALSAIMAGQVMIIPTLAATFTKIVNAENTKNVFDSAALLGSFCIAFSILVGAMVALALKDNAKDYAQRNDKPMRFVHRRSHRERLASRPIRK